MNTSSDSSAETTSEVSSHHSFNNPAQHVSQSLLQKKARKAPNKFLAPVVIAGVTIGFLASAYKFVFAKPEPVKKEVIASKGDPQNNQDVTPSQ